MKPAIEFVNQLEGEFVAWLTFEKLFEDEKEELAAFIKRIQVDARDRDSHWGDCAIFSAMINGSPKDGICDCGYGRLRLEVGDPSEQFSVERLANIERCCIYCGQPASDAVVISRSGALNFYHNKCARNNAHNDVRAEREQREEI